MSEAPPGYSSAQVCYGSFPIILWILDGVLDDLSAGEVLRVTMEY